MTPCATKNASAVRAPLPAPILVGESRTRKAAAAEREAPTQDQTSTEKGSKNWFHLEVGSGTSREEVRFRQKHKLVELHHEL